MKNILIKIKKLLANKQALSEVAKYIIFGALTTLVNFVCFWFFRNIIVLDLLVANTIAWILSVLFAFFTNKAFVFKNQSDSLSHFFKALLLFFIARVASFLIFDSLALWFMVEILNINELIAKLIDNVFVVIFNYFASKLIIFKK